MKKIGLFLDIRGEGGGAFQYSLSVLHALEKLASSYEIVIVYTNEHWTRHITHKQYTTIYKEQPAWLSFAQLAWRKVGLPFFLWRDLVAYFMPFQRFLLKQQCDIWIFPAQDSMAYMLPVNALSTIHDLMHRYESQFPEVSGFRLREYHYKAICKISKGILVDSETGKKQVKDSYQADPEKIFVLPYTPPAYMYAEHGADIEVKYNLPEKFFFYPAQFWQHKNHELIIKAVANLRDRLPDISFVFSGAPKNHYNALLRMITELGLTKNFVITGYISNEDISGIYKKARALVMPTFFGPTNIPPLEAMVVGCPVAISGIYGMPEQIKDAGIMFDQKSVAELEETLYRLWTDDELCHDLAEKGKRRVKELDQDAFDKKFYSIIEQIFS